MRLGAASRMLAAMLIGLGAAIVVRTFQADGEATFRVGYLVGPALMAAGIARLRLTGRGRGEG